MQLTERLEETYLVPAEEKVLPVAINIDDKFAPYAEVLLFSIVKHLASEWRCQIYVLEKSLSMMYQDRLTAFVSKLLRCGIKFIQMSDAMFGERALPANSQWSEAAFYRLVIPEILPEYSRVLYLDTDMVVQEDLSPLMSMDMGENYLAAVSDLIVNGQKNLRDYAEQQLGLPKDVPYFNSGMLVFNVPVCRREKLTDQLLDALERIPKPLFVDQCLLNACCHGRRKFLDYRWNFMHFNQAMVVEPDIRPLSPKITHYLYPKPWTDSLNPMNALWWQYKREADIFFDSDGMDVNIGQERRRFSLLLPLHNAGQWVVQCIASILRQTFVDFELLVCDDASQDNTWEIIRQFGQGDSRIKYYHLDDGLGINVTRNLLVRLAVGEYSFLINAADTLAPDFLAVADQALRQFPSDILGMPYEMAMPDGTRQVMRQPGFNVSGGSLNTFFLNMENPIGALLVSNVPAHPWHIYSKAIRTAVLRQAVPPNTDKLLADRFWRLPLFHYATSYRWEPVEQPLYCHDARHDVEMQLGKPMELDTFRSFCHCLYEELVYNLNFALQYRYVETAYHYIVNLCGLEALLKSALAFSPSKQLSALTIFFEDFCVDEQLLRGSAANIQADSIIHCILQNFTCISKEVLEGCRQAGKDKTVPRPVIPDEYLQAYSLVQGIRKNPAQFLYDSFGMLEITSGDTVLSEAFKDYFLSPHVNKVKEYYTDSESHAVIDEWFNRLLSLPSKHLSGFFYRPSLMGNQREKEDYADFSKLIPQYRIRTNHIFQSFEPTCFYYRHGLKYIEDSSIIAKIRDGVAFDCGAFDGASVVVMDEYCPVKIYSFEPTLKNYDICRNVLRHIDIHTPYEVINSCVGDQDGTITFEDRHDYSSHINHGESISEYTVSAPITRLDTFCQERNIAKVSWIKGDVEGAGLDLVKGAEMIIRRDKPIITIGVYHNPQEFFLIPELLHKLVPEYRMLMRRCQCEPLALCNEMTLIAYVGR